MVGVVCSCVGNVVEDFLAGKAVACSDGEAADRAEGSFRVDVEALPFAATHVEWELACYGESVADLGLSCAELAKDLGNGAGLYTAGEEGVELLGAGGDGDEVGAALVHFCGGGEAHGDMFSSW